MDEGSRINGRGAFFSATWRTILIQPHFQTVATDLIVEWLHEFGFDFRGVAPERVPTGLVCPSILSVLARFLRSLSAPSRRARTIIPCSARMAGLGAAGGRRSWLNIREF